MQQIFGTLLVTSLFSMRRDGRVAEGGGLLNRLEEATDVESSSYRALRGNKMHGESLFRGFNATEYATGDVAYFPQK